MQPPIMILNVQGSTLGLNSSTHFFWGTGLLSSILDNAPTYVVFFETARSIGGADPVAQTGVPTVLLSAISLGAVFMGANTYIGNGPNFMVKAIAEGSGVRMPSFFGYLAYSGAVLIPIFILITVLFFIEGAPLRWLVE
jgi:Na+/H+ antiporter NhaD/arsenite permease-like protein